MARFGGHGENSTVPTTEYNIELLCRAGKSQHLMRLPPDVISLEQPLELLGGQRHHFLLKQPWPDKPLPALDHLVYDDKAVAVPVKDLHGVMTATDEAMRQRRDRPSSLPGRARQGSSAPSSCQQDHDTDRPSDPHLRTKSCPHPHQLGKPLRIRPHPALDQPSARMAHPLQVPPLTQRELRLLLLGHRSPSACGHSPRPRASADQIKGGRTGFPASLLPRGANPCPHVIWQRGDPDRETAAAMCRRSVDCPRAGAREHGIEHRAIF